MGEKVGFLTIPICEICKKQGAVSVPIDQSLATYLYQKKRDGFIYRSMVGGGWYLVCEDCEKKNEEFKDRQKKEIADFYSK